MRDIELYVVITTLFPPQTFFRDLELIEAFKTFDNHPTDRNLESMYKGQTESVYYFGEYLSQGALMISNKCQVVFARNRLQFLQVNMRVPTA